MARQQATVQPTDSAEVLRKERLSGLLDSLVTMRWDLTDNVQDVVGLAVEVSERLAAVERELDNAISAVKEVLHHRDPRPALPHGDPATNGWSKSTPP